MLSRKANGEGGFIIYPGRDYIFANVVFDVICPPLSDSIYRYEVPFVCHVFFRGRVIHVESVGGFPSFKSIVINLEFLHYCRVRYE